MPVYRLVSEKKQNIRKLAKKFFGKKIKDLSLAEKDELLELIAKTLNLL